MGDKILVTGATGTVGSQVVKQLKEKGASFRAAAHSPASAEKLKGDGVDSVLMDFSKPDTLQESLDGIDSLFFLSAMTPDFVEAGGNVIDSAKKAGVTRIVRLSGLGADAEPGIKLSRLHREVEKMIESSGIAYSFLRPNSFMQNYSNMYAQTVKTQNAFYLPHGDAGMSLIDARDIARVAVKALTEDGHEGEAYELTGPDAISNAEIAEILSTLTGRKINYVDVTEEQAKNGMKEAGMPDWFIEMLMELYAINKAGYTAAVSPTVETVTGNKPISFRQFAEDHIDAFK